MNEEKDRFGDVISLLERAREDVYFAAKDRELIDKLKRRLEETRQETLEHRAMSCPQCRSPLHNSSYMDSAISRCTGCGGIWISPGELQRFLNMKKIEAKAADPWSKHSLRYIWPSERPQVMK
jgi:Zn-finger nucleic acid-binding protein